MKRLRDTAAPRPTLVPAPVLAPARPRRAPRSLDEASLEKVVGGAMDDWEAPNV